MKRVPNANCIETIGNVLSVQQKYWKSLKFNKKLPVLNEFSDINVLEKQLNILTIADDNRNTECKKDVKSEINEPQPGTSTGNSSKQTKTLSEYLEENRNALQNEEMFAVVPLNDCPHLSTLNPETAPNGI